MTFSDPTLRLFDPGGRQGDFAPGPAATGGMAERRADALLRAGRALHDSLARLDEAAGLDRLLGLMLETVARQLGEDSGGVWLHDPERDLLRLHLSLERGRLESRPESGHPGATLDEDGQDVRNRRAHNALYRGGRAIQFGPDILYGDPTWEAYRPYFRQAGVRALLSLPLFAGSAFLGCMTIRARRRDAFSASEVELAQAVAEQAAVALHLARLADQASEAALARERERAAFERTAELARANAALREGLSVLAEGADIGAFLRHQLRIIAEQFGCSDAGLWVACEDPRLQRLMLSLEDGRVVDAAESRHPLAGTDQPRFLGNALADRIHRDHAPVLFPIAEYRDPTNPWHAPVVADQLEAAGIRAVLLLPLVVGGAEIGSLALRLGSAEPVPEAKLELARALAGQSALALHLSRLAAAERDAAVAREREASARMRAEKLAAANRLLRESAERLGAIEDIDAFLGQVLLTITELLGARSATVWTRDARAQVLRYVVEDGIAIPAARSSHPNATDPLEDVSENLMPGVGTSAAQPVVTEIGATTLPQSTKDYLRDMGVGALLGVPMVFAGEHIGSFTVRLAAADPLSPDDKELVQALGNQAAVALHLTCLAEQAREAAVAKAREDAARQRADELAKANAALAESIATLSAEGDVDAYLGGMLRILLDQMGSDSGSLWRVDADGWYRLHSEVVGGAARRLDASGHPGAAACFSAVGRNAAARRSHEMQAVGRRPVVYPDVATAPEYDGEEAMRAYLLSLGVRSQLIAPLFSGERHLGSFSVRSAGPAAWSAAQIELVQALANQAALAIEINRLSIEARESAVAHAREAAARARAEKIAAANRLLLGPVGDVDALLGRVLLSIAELLGGQSAALWTLDAEAGEQRLHSVLEDGKAVPAAASAHPNAWAAVKVSPEAASAVPGFGGGAARPSQFRLEDMPTLTPVQRAYLAGLGVRSMVAVPVVLNDEHFGNVTIRLSDDRPVLEEDRELVQTLANQAAVALNLTRAAEEARRAALTDERNRMAREIHDTLAQGFAAIALQLQAAERAAGSLPASVAGPLGVARRLAHDNLIEARRSLDILKSGSDAALAAGLARLADSIRRAGDARVALDLRPASEPPGPVAHELLRIAQEALANALRHSAAGRITVSLHPAGEGGVTLRVADDGAGFDPEAAGGFGLAGMRERAAAIGAGLTVISEAGGGTEVIAFWANPETTPRRKA